MSGNTDDKSSFTSENSFVEALTSDLGNVNKFVNASINGDKSLMIEAFNSFSWNDRRILDHLPKFCEASENDRMYIDDVFRILCPFHNKVLGPSFNTMALWFKTRLHFQHSNSPFSFKSDSRDYK